MGQNNRRGTYLYAIIMLILAMVILQFINSSNVTPPVEYNEVISLFKQGEVAQYELDFNNRELTYILWGDKESAEKENRDPKSTTVKVPDVNLFIRDVHELVNEYNEKNPDKQVVQYYVAVKEASALASWLPMILLAGSMIFMWYMIMRQTRGSGNPLSFAKAKPKQPDDKDKVTFDDVAGADEEKQELEEIVEFLKNPEKFNALGARIPRGVLLMGPPGTGKTLLAKAVAGEAGVPFFSISGSDFVEMYVGVGASRVRDLFEQAKKNAPSIVFIDEIDAVGRHRGAGLGGGHDEREQTLNQLLVEMDGFGTNSGVIVMAATNRRDILDPALLRPGRFDRQITVNYPDVKGREAILRVHTRKKPLAPDVDLAVIARSTGGFTGADLENLCNEAALLAARRYKKAITMDEIKEATIKVTMGPEKRSKVVSKKERNMVAYHEGGHAIVMYHCKNHPPLHQVSIIPRGDGTGGFTMWLPEKDEEYLSKTLMEERISVMLGGRIAEKIFLDEITTGASSDIQQATKSARAMVSRFGFSDRLGPIVYGRTQDEVFLGMEQGRDASYSEKTAAIIDEEIQRIIDEANERATKILDENKEKMHQLVEYLEEFEIMDRDPFYRFMDGKATLEELKEEARKEAEIARSKQKAQEQRAAQDSQRREARRRQNQGNYTPRGNMSNQSGYIGGNITPGGQNPPEQHIFPGGGDDYAPVPPAENPQIDPPAPRQPEQHIFPEGGDSVTPPPPEQAPPAGDNFWGDPEDDRK